MTDLMLILKMKNGNQSAFTNFVSKYYEDIRNYCLHHCIDKNQAEDFTQETFLHFFESLSRYEYRGKTKNFLYTIANNLIKNEIKRKKAYPVMDENIFDLNFDYTYNDADMIVDKLFYNGLIQQLPTEFQEVIKLYYYDDLQLSEISNRLGISLSLTKYRLKRAKKILKEILVNESS